MEDRELRIDGSPKASFGFAQEMGGGQSGSMVTLE